MMYVIILPTPLIYLCFCFSPSPYRKHVVLDTETEHSFTENAFQVGAVVVGFDRYFNYYKIQ